LSEDPVPEVAGDWFAAMRAGDWESAWRATDRIEVPRRARQASPGFIRRPEHLRWDGTPLAGRTVLVRCEHGLGDTLQFMRFVPVLGAATVHLMVQPHLVRLLRNAPGLGQVHDYWTDEAPPAHEVDIEVMELAYATRCTLATVPPPYPHLRAQLPRSRLLPARDQDRLRVGLLWAASDWDSSRSLSLAAMALVFEIPGVEFFSLQQGPAAADPLLREHQVEVLSTRTAQVEMAAAAMCELDLVITVDGMAAHLAGTLGRPTWVVLKHQADWRWMDDAKDTPWYPSMRLFRQPRAGDWAGAMQEVANALRNAASARGLRSLLSAAAPGR
jgi:hypothetical protein